MFIRDHDMDWNPNDWNSFQSTFTVPKGMTTNNVKLIRAFFSGGPRGSVLLLDDLLFSKLPTLKEASNAKATAPIATNISCDQLIQGNDAESGKLSGWHDWYSTIDMVSPGYGGNGYAYKAYNRDKWYHGMTQNLPLSCLQVGTIWHITFKAKLYDEKTGNAISCRSENKKYKGCPLVQIEIKTSMDANIYFLRDNTMTWIPRDWSTYNKKIRITREMVGQGATSFRVAFIGGPPGSVLLLDDVYWEKHEPSNARVDRDDDGGDMFIEGDVESERVYDMVTEGDDESERNDDSVIS